jgi:DNA-binding transcriptional LysR family regulator
MLFTDGAAIRDVLLFPTMKSMDAKKPSEETAAEAVAGLPAIEGIPAISSEKPDFSNVVIEPLFEDPLYVAVPEQIAAERTGDEEIVDLHKYQDVPFIRDLHQSASASTIDSFLARENISLNNVVSINDYNEQAALCMRLGGAMFCSKSFAFFEGGEIMRKGLRILGIEGLHHSVTICLITSAPRVYTRCVREFIDISRDSLLKFYEDHIR